MREYRLKNNNGTGLRKGLAFLLILVCFPAFGQLSPGDLSKVHSRLEGLSNCTKCHILGEKVSSQKCLDCHTEIRDRVNAGKGYHASAGVRGKECASCHSDHHGLSFQIIRFNRDQFNHELTGYPLKGAHAAKKCTDCHKSERVRDPKARKKMTTFLGLGTDCLSCHADYHQKTLSTNCSDCHNSDSFKPATGFDHNRTGFPLAGKHREVACSSCHKVSLLNNLKFQAFRGVSHNNCTDCHADPHQGRFGAACSQCHSELSFAQIKGVDNFDHNRTAFPLEGRHRGVACNTCHKTRMTSALKFARCSDCHDDFHKGQMARNGSSPDCSQCHQVEGFYTFSFSTGQHENTAFPLRGAHLATPCISCHLKGAFAPDTLWRFENIGSTCRDCHPDIHKGSLPEKYYPASACTNCHQESRWNRVTFNHDLTAFPLVGAHAGRSCRACHFMTTAGVTRKQFSGMEKKCSGCHTDIHAGQFTAAGETDCSRCHTETAFRPASRFDHARTKFPLEGKHAELACDRCHKKIPANGTAYVLYKIPEFKCENCHH